MQEQSFRLCQCRILYNRRLGQLHEWLNSSGIGYQLIDRVANFGHYGANDVDGLRDRQTLALTCPLQLLEGPSWC